MTEERGCGRRFSGIYACCGVSPYGKTALWELTPCPPFLPPERLFIPDLGSVIAPNWDGYDHVWDRKGLSHYPNVADFYEEGRRMGFSTRLSPLLDFSRLKAGAGIYHLHPRAYIENWREYGFRHERCRGNVPDHDQETAQDEFCNGLWWQDLEGGEGDPENPGFVIRKMPSFSYSGQARPAGVTPVYTQMVFLFTPITHFEVLPGNEEETENWRKSLGESERPHTIVEE